MSDTDRLTLEDVDAEFIIVPRRPSRNSSKTFHIPAEDGDGDEPLCDSCYHDNAHFKRVAIEYAPLSCSRLCRRCEHYLETSDYELDTANQGPTLNAYLHDDDITDAAEALQEYMADRAEWEGSA